tara:strand:- start:2016 stop:2627 length:612 start_codon:yes stop_codon:yes gene_type:complete
VSPFLPPLLLASALLGLSACAATPESAEAPSEAPPAEAGAAVTEAPQLTLNLPSRSGCDCASKPASRDYTFLERGYRALSEGDAVAALQHFQRYKRLELEPAAQWEADIAIAYLGMLPDSPFYDHDAAEATFRRLVAQFTDEMQVHPTALLMRDSLAAFALLNRHISDLESSNATLREDLQKREEAIKRLRELTLGPSRAVQP